MRIHGWAWLVLLLSTSIATGQRAGDGITPPKSTLPNPFDPPAPGAQQPTPRVGAADAKQQEAVTRTFDYLMKEYTAMLNKHRDRTSRGLVLVCMARVPRADATAKLIEVLRTDRDPLVAMTAWQCLFSRGAGISDAEYRQWHEATPALLAKGAFRGDLRAALGQFLAAGPPDKRGRDMFAQLFAITNSQRFEDRAVMMELARCVQAWQDPQIVEWLMGRFAVLNDAYRAEEILRSAGVGDSIPMPIMRMELGTAETWRLTALEYQAWWKANKAAWKGPPAGEERWRSLGGQYVPTVTFDGDIDPEAPEWRRDLELRPPNLRTFGVGLCVDATGSMQATLMWLRDDVRRMMQAFGLVALEPQIGITFYRDAGDAFVTQSVPLTANVDLLIKALTSMDAKGGGDKPEAILDAMQACMKGNRWHGGAKAPKAMVIIGDAPPHPASQAACEKLAASAAADAFRIYAVKVLSGYEDLTGWPALDALAKAGNGVSMEVDFRGGYRLTSVSPAGPFAGPGPADAALGAANNAAQNDGRSPGERVVTQVVIDVVNPQFADRVQPVVATLWQMLAPFEPEKRMPTPPIPKIEFRPPPPMNIPPLPPVRPMPPMKVEPYDPQKQR